MGLEGLVDVGIDEAVFGEEGDFLDFLGVFFVIGGWGEGECDVVFVDGGGGGPVLEWLWDVGVGFLEEFVPVRVWGGGLVEDGEGEGEGGGAGVAIFVAAHPGGAAL